MNKKLLAAAVTGAILAPTAAMALDFKVSGHVNRMIRFVDDGEASDIQFTGNTASRSRFRFIASGDVGNGMKAGVRYEIGMSSNRSGSIPLKSGDTGDSFSGTGSDIRHEAVWFSGNFGKVTLGHTSEASDGTAFSDKSGTWMADESAVAEHVSAVGVRTRAGGASGLTLGSTHSSLDAGGRNDLLRYDTPAFGPVTAAASVSNNDRWAVGAFLNHGVGGGDLSASAGYTDANGAELWALSASFLFSQGTNITGSYGNRDRDGGGAAGRESDHFYVKLGHKWGNNAISASYSETNDNSAKGVDGESFGVGWTHTLSKPGISLYAGYHHLANDASAGARAALGGGTAATAIGQLEDADVFVVGSRIVFK